MYLDLTGYKEKKKRGVKMDVGAAGAGGAMPNTPASAGAQGVTTPVEEIPPEMEQGRDAQAGAVSEVEGSGEQQGVSSCGQEGQNSGGMNTQSFVELHNFSNEAQASSQSSSTGAEGENPMMKMIEMILALQMLQELNKLIS